MHPLLRNDSQPNVLPGMREAAGIRVLRSDTIGQALYEVRETNSATGRGAFKVLTMGNDDRFIRAIEYGCMFITGILGLLALIALVGGCL